MTKLSPLALLGDAVTRKFTPVLQSVLVTPQHLYATDLDVGVSVPANGFTLVGADAACVPFADLKRLADGAKLETIGVALREIQPPTLDAEPACVRAVARWLDTESFDAVVLRVSNAADRTAIVAWANARGADIVDAAAYTHVVSEILRLRDATRRPPERYLDLAAGDLSLEGIEVLDTADFPAPPDSNAPRWFDGTIDAAQLLDALARVAPAMANNPTRFNLCAACVEPETGRVVATDGHRLHTASCAWTTRAIDRDRKDGKGDPIVPPSFVHGCFAFGLSRRLVEILVKRLGTVSGALHVWTTDAIVLVEAVETGVRWHARVADGQFPDHRQFIPRDADLTWKLVASRVELRTELARLAKLIGRDTGLLVLSPGGGAELRVEGKKVRSRAIKLGVESDLPSAVGLNIDYALDALDALSGDAVAIEGDAKAIHWRGGGVQCLVMQVCI